MTSKEIVTLINESKIIQDSSYDEQEFPEIIQTIIDQSKILTEGLDVDKHRWYETSITVYQYGNEIFGIQYVTDLFSEQSSFEDIYWTIYAYEMQEEKVISYKIK